MRWRGVKEARERLPDVERVGIAEIVAASTPEAKTYVYRVHSGGSLCNPSHDPSGLLGVFPTRGMMRVHFIFFHPPFIFFLENPHEIPF